MSQRRAALLAGGIVVAVLSLVSVVMWSTFGGRLLWPTFQDDAYYYFVVANNATHGRGLTLDWNSQTNGFHPLWFVTMLPIFAVFEVGSNAGVAVVQGLSILLYGLTVVLLFDLVLRLDVKTSIAWLVPLLALFGPFVSHGMGGMEGAVSLPILVIAMRLLVVCPSIVSFGRESAPLGATIAFGITLGFLVLSRLDTVFSAFAVGLAVCWNALLGPRPARPRPAALLTRLASMFVPLLLVLVPYLTWNRVMFGHVVPISGALKSSFPHPSWHARWLTEFPHWFALLVPMGVWALVGRRKGLGKLRDSESTIFIWVLGCMFHAAYTLLFARWAVHGWHFAQFIPAAVVTALLLIDRLVRNASPVTAGYRGPEPIVWLATFAVVCSSVAVSIRKVVTEVEFRTAAYDAAAWARANTRPSDLFAMSDAGVFSYYSQRPCVNLDGVINSWEFQRVLASGQLQEYLEQERAVKYLVHHAVDADKAESNAVEIRFRSKLSPDRGSTLRLAREREVFRSETYRSSGGGRSFLAVWSLARD